MPLDLNDMSDEDFAKVSEADLINGTNTEVIDTPVVTDTVVVDEPLIDKEANVEDKSKGVTDPVIKPTDPVDDAGNAIEDPNKGKEPNAEAKTDKVVDPAAKEEETKPKQTESATPEAQLARLFAPFKANGREMKVESVEEALALMQKGVGFQKRMSELKRAQKIEKMLDDNDIDESRLNFLIDVSKNSKEAISKLIQESGIDALDLGEDKAKLYTPSVHSVSDKELALDEVLKELQSSPTVKQTLNVVTKEWDKASRDHIADAPQLLKVIDEHVSNGVYDLITSQMELQGALGKLKGLSNIEAYQQVGDALHAAGKFAHIYGSSKDSQQTTDVPVVVQPKLKQAEDDEQRAARRKAASGTPPAASVAKPTSNKSVFDMSPEEFEKFKPNFN